MPLGERAMTKTDPALLLASGGEARSRRRSRILYGLFFFSLLLGLAVGVGMGMAEDGSLNFTHNIAWALAIMAGLLIAALSVWFYRWADEVEVLDNLWANTVALHVGFAVGVPWFFLAETGYAPPLKLSVLFLIIAGTAALYYTAVKLWRLK